MGGGGGAVTAFSCLWKGWNKGEVEGEGEEKVEGREEKEVLPKQEGLKKKERG